MSRRAIILTAAPVGGSTTSPGGLLMARLLLSRGRTAHTRSRPPRYLVSLLGALALLAVPGVASAANGFQEQVASLRLSVTFQCPDGSTAHDGRMIVETDNFIEAGTTPDPNPPLRVGFTGQCPAPDGTTRTFSWGFTRPAETQFDSHNLKSASVSGTFANVRDNGGVLHTVSVDARWTGAGPLMTTVNGPGSKRMERTATANVTIIFDGSTLFDGASNFPFPKPFIRVDTEK
jgi:hypothetical protein